MKREWNTQGQGPQGAASGSGRPLLTSSRLMRAGTYILVSVASLVVLASCDGRDSEADSREKSIHEIVAVGMDIDEAIELLREAGFAVGEKYFPTEDADYWLAHIGIRDEIPPSATIEEVTGTPMDSPKTTVTLKADMAGQIVSIE